MNAIIGLTTAYVVAIAIAFSVFISSSNSTINNVGFGEIAFALPMIVASLLAWFLRRDEARRVLLKFETGFSILSLLIFVATFFGEHDAQYQLALLLIPLIGFPAVLVAGVAAAFPTKDRQGD